MWSSAFDIQTLARRHNVINGVSIKNIFHFLFNMRYHYVPTGFWRFEPCPWSELVASSRSGFSGYAQHGDNAAAAQALNQLPLRVRAASSIVSFWRELRSFLFSRSFSLVNAITKLWNSLLTLHGNILRWSCRSSAKVPPYIKCIFNNNNNTNNNNNNPESLGWTGYKAQSRTHPL